MKKKKFIISFIVIIIIAAFIIIKIITGNKSGPIQVTTELSANRPIITSVEATGTVALEDSNRFYSSSSALIKEIYVNEGDMVKKGQILFTYNEKALDELKNQLETAKLDVKSNEVALNSINLEADASLLAEYSANIEQCDTNIASINYKLQQLDIQIKQGEDDLIKAKTDFENDTVLYNNGGLSLDSLNNSKNTYNSKLSDLELLKSQKQEQQLALNTENSNKEVAKAKYNQLINQNNTSEINNKKSAQKILLEQSKLKVTQLQAEIDKFVSVETSPYDGYIINIQDNFMSGSSISEGTYLFEIANENTIVNLDVPEYDMQTVALNQPVTITCDGYDSEFNGKVTKIYPTAEKKTIKNSEKNVVTVQVTLDSHTPLSLGFSVDGKIITNTNDNAIVIPSNSYLTDDTGIDYVYIVDNDSIVQRKNITIKNFDNNYIEVEGIDVGEKIITSPDETVISEGIQVLEEGTSND